MQSKASKRRIRAVLAIAAVSIVGAAIYVILTLNDSARPDH